MAARRHLAHAQEAARLLGTEITARRKERRWSEAELAERAGISRTTLRKIEAGHTGVAIGTAFDVATLVGVLLYRDSAANVARERMVVEQRLALMPDRIRVASKEVFDDF